MQITLKVSQDAETAGCPWPEVKDLLRHWAANHASWDLIFRFPSQKIMVMTLDLQAEDHLTAVRQLHDKLYDLPVNFTLIFH